MSQAETNRLISKATGGSVRTVEGWRSKDHTNAAAKVAKAAMESLDKGGEPVRLGPLEIRCSAPDHSAARAESLASATAPDSPEP